MADITRCTAGKNNVGKWHIAGDEPAMSGLGILQNMRYTRELSNQAIHFDRAAMHIRDRGGRSWTTNVLGAYLTPAGIPKNPGG
ncbi:hypothetical protein [Afifella sp. YEN Y35]|uniref:hypothetical protein n=1 Tax=Afifella sp. YEN Y35 TaxID=3388337 RepID=UPI0039DF5DE6